MRKPSARSPREGEPVKVTSANCDTKILAQCPQVMAFLTHSKYDDGQPRVTGRIFLSMSGTLFRLTLADKDTGLSISVVEATIDDAFALAELQLSADDPPWEADPFETDRNRAGKKK